MTTIYIVMIMCLSVLIAICSILVFSVLPEETKTKLRKLVKRLFSSNKQHKGEWHIGGNYSVNLGFFKSNGTFDFTNKPRKK